MRKLIAAAALFFLVAAPALAAPKPENPDLQTAWDLYLTSKEAYALKTKEGDAVLFIDVREPVEIMFTGFTEIVDENIPFLMVDPAKWNREKSVLAMERNPEFGEQILQALRDRGLGLDTPVILMCRSGGERGAPSARALEGLGLDEVHVVVDGFEGPTAKDDPNGPVRNVSGWKNSGLPWSYRLNANKIHMRPAD